MEREEREEKKVCCDRKMSIEYDSYPSSDSEGYEPDDDTPGLQLSS